MKILYNSPSGKVILNPPDLIRFAAQAKFNAAALVVAGGNIIASTLELGDHNSMMEMAGIEVMNFNLQDQNPENFTFRGGIQGGEVKIDIWHQGDEAEIERNVEALQKVLDFLKANRGLRKSSSIELVIYDSDYVETHIFNDNGLSRTAALTLT